MSGSGNESHASGMDDKRRCLIKHPVVKAPMLNMLCSHLDMSWECIKQHMFLLHGDVAETFVDVSFTMLQMARQKCTGEEYYHVLILVVGLELMTK